jgi:Tetracyclin repressor-like, C-terminal domain
MTISSLCFYYVSNRFTFGHIFNVELASPGQAERRRAEIVDSVLRICRA